MAFTFRLQTLLNLSERIQDEKSGVLGAAQARHQAERERLLALESSAADRMRDLASATRVGSLDLEAIQWSHRYLDHLAGEEVGQRRKLEETHASVEAAREELIVAARKVQVLLKLRERASAAHFAVLERKEAAFIDELATLRHGR